MDEGLTRSDSESEDIDAPPDGPAELVGNEIPDNLPIAPGPVRDGVEGPPNITEGPIGLDEDDGDPN